MGTVLPQNERNMITEEGVILGKKLFYDPILSANGKVSCATCHKPELAFTDGLALTTKGVSGQPLKRNVPTLTNAAWIEGLFWDGGANDLESLTFGPLTHEDEMAADLTQVLAQLKEDDEYVSLFNNAFPELGVSTSALSRALSQFERTLVSADSKYDRYVRNEGVNLSEEELDGLLLFKEKCAGCHAMDHFTDYSYHNNGLDASFVNEDFEGIFQGRFRITRDSSDLGKYKTPTLRNIALTAPYMHDGRFASLEEVLEHYNSGVKYSGTLDALLQSGDAIGIAITEVEKKNLILFLNTLTDTNFITNPQFKN
ncbi:cytochrome-c peroxidase [Marivirga lumbricoides]|uniref:Cytochrome-c peroxidase n=1 Tax=Marivirga lumbricoides TaxID=1046115 RepID=A0A2T4DMN2_9BACT|nr:cytochrome-c peroxidase [Marivirga lumbricoides]